MLGLFTMDFQFGVPGCGSTTPFGFIDIFELNSLLLFLSVLPIIVLMPSLMALFHALQAGCVPLSACMPRHTCLHTCPPVCVCAHTPIHISKCISKPLSHQDQARARLGALAVLEESVGLLGAGMDDVCNDDHDKPLSKRGVLCPCAGTRG